MCAHALILKLGSYLCVFFKLIKLWFYDYKRDKLLEIMQADSLHNKIKSMTLNLIRQTCSLVLRQ